MTEGRGPVVLLPHIPKCAGSTVEGHLLAHLGAAFWAPGRRARRWPLELFGRKHEMPPAARPEAIRVAAGHYLGQSAAALFQGRRIHRVLLMREPEALQLSWYNYRMMRYRAAGQRSYGLDLHLATLPPDPMAHFLLERWLEMPWARMAAMGAEEKRASLDAALGKFDLVADVSRTDEVVATVSGVLGLPDRAPALNRGEDWRTATGWAVLTRDALGPAERALLERRTRLDRYLWRRWALGERASFDAAGAVPFVAAELARPFAEIRRRMRRGRGRRGGVPVPAPGTTSGT